MNQPATTVYRYLDAPNKYIEAAGTTFAYRDLGPHGNVPLLLLNHWGAVLDNFDPAIVDGLAADRRVIALNYRGVGASAGQAPLTVRQMADDVLALITAMGFAKVDLLGFSLGGFVAQDVAIRAPARIRRLILTGTGPAGGAGIDRVGAISRPLMLKGLLTLRDPKFYLFFTTSTTGRHAARVFLKRLKQHRRERDKSATPAVLYRQLEAIKAWGRQPAQDLGRLTMPVLIANGDQDLMVPSILSRDLAARIPNAELVLYPDAGHGGIFQYHSEFVTKARAFLAE